MTWVSFNINEEVRVKLTDYGQQIHRSYYVSIATSFPVKDKEVDSDGYSRYQLWELMKIFGKYMDNIHNRDVFAIEILFPMEHLYAPFPERSHVL